MPPHPQPSLQAKPADVMMHSRIFSVIAVALAVLSAVDSAQAQASFSIPNPLIKPRSAGAPIDAASSRGPSSRADGEDSRLPKTSVATMPPLPGGASGHAPLPGQLQSESAPTSEAVIRDTLGTFTVTAIVNSSAVLRNNAGYQPVHNGLNGANGQQGFQSVAGAVVSSGNGTGSMASQALQRQTVIRVKSGVPVYVAGVSLTPTVSESQVDFYITGKKNVVATVVLDPQSAHGYVPSMMTREVPDPSVQTRVSPLTPSSVGGAGLSTTGSITPSTTSAQPVVR